MPTFLTIRKLCLIQVDGDQMDTVRIFVCLLILLKYLLEGKLTFLQLRSLTDSAVACKIPGVAEPQNKNYF